MDAAGINPAGWKASVFAILSCLHPRLWVRSRVYLFRGAPFGDFIMVGLSFALKYYVIIDVTYNSLTYNTTKLITAVKRFYGSDPGCLSLTSI